MRVAAKHAAVLSLVCLSVAGCKPAGPNYQRPEALAPEAKSPIPAEYKNLPAQAPVGGAWAVAAPDDAVLRGQWWVIFHDEQLNTLEAQASSANQSLKAAAANYAASRESVKVARAAYYPTLSAGPSYAHDRISQNRPNVSSVTRYQYNDLNLGGQASWEPDLWGQVRRSVEQAGATAQAIAADAANVDLSVHAELAMDYFELRGLDAQRRLLVDTVDFYEKQLDLTHRRVAGGVATEVDEEQARTQLETTRAQLIDLNVARAQFEDAIATLAGIPASSFKVDRQPKSDFGELPVVPVTVPSQILQRRPDVAAAERRAQEANAQIGIAISAYYPNITLGLSGGFESTQGGTWLQGPAALWSLGASATQLLFDAGRRHALTRQARDQYDVSVANYRQTVLEGFQEVEDNLAALNVLREEAKTEHLAVAAAQRSLALSNQRYKGGVTSYLEVLTAENTLLQNQRTETDLTTREFAAEVGLVRSLGGGWDVTQLPK